VATYAQWLILRAERSGAPPPANIMRLIGRSVPALAVAAVVLAVIVFG